MCKLCLSKAFFLGDFKKSKILLGSIKLLWVEFANPKENKTILLTEIVVLACDRGILLWTIDFGRRAGEFVHQILNQNQYKICVSQRELLDVFSISDALLPTPQ